VVELLSEYGLFLAKAVTVVIAILFVIGGIASSSMRGRSEQNGLVKVTHLNEAFDEMTDALKSVVLTRDQLKEEEKAEKKKEKEERKAAKKLKDEDKKDKKRIYVLDFDGDVKAEGVEALGTEITAVLSLATKNDEIVLRLESPGGQVHAYGLAASQLSRINDRGIPFTVCVDKVAASGGYMMACIADNIIAAPFSILGSVGVVAELPNFNKVMKKYDVDYDVYTAGAFKRTVTVLGENTDEGKAKFVEELESTHVLFKEWVSANRPSLDIEKIATGEHWYGSQALELGLIDSLKTSEDYLFDASKDADVYEVSFQVKQSVADKLGFAAEKAATRSLTRWWSEITARHNRIV